MKRVIAREKGADQNALLKLPSCKFLDHQSDRSVQCKYLRNLEKSLEPRNPFARFSDLSSSGKCPSPPASAMNGPTSIGSASSLPPRHSEAPTQSCFLQCRSSGARASDQGAELDIHAIHPKTDIFELQIFQNWLTISLGSNLQDTLRASHLLGQLDVDVLKFVSSVHSE